MIETGRITLRMSRYACVFNCWNMIKVLQFWPLRYLSHAELDKPTIIVCEEYWPLTSLSRLPFFPTLPGPSGAMETCGEPPHQICSYTLLFSLFLRFPYIADPPLRTSTPMRLHAIVLALAWQSHSLYWTDLAYLMDIRLTIHMYLLLFLVSPMCPLLQSDQSWVLAPCGQALFLTSPYARILVYHLYLHNLPVFTFRQKKRSSPKP